MAIQPADQRLVDSLREGARRGGTHVHVASANPLRLIELLEEAGVVDSVPVTAAPAPAAATKPVQPPPATETNPPAAETPVTQPAVADPPAETTPVSAETPPAETAAEPPAETAVAETPAKPAAESPAEEPVTPTKKSAKKK